MGICNLDENKELGKSLAKYLNISIKNSLKPDGKSFKLITTMKEVYALVHSKDQDTNKALGVAGAIPELFLSLLEHQPKYLRQLEEKGFKRDPVVDFNKEIKNATKPLDLIAKHVLGVSNQPTVSQATQNIVSIENPSVIRKKAEKISTYTDRKLTGNTLQKTIGVSTVKKSKDDIASIDEQNPDKINSFEALGQILMQQNGEETFENVTYDNHKGFRLRGIIEGALPNPDKNVYSEDKGSSITPVLAITDNQGNFIYFDQDGRITTADKGKISYQSLPAIKEPAKEIANQVAMALANEESGLREATKGNIKEYEERRKVLKDLYTKIFTEEVRFINETKEKIVSNEKVLVNITGGKVGSIDDRNISTTVSEMYINDQELSSMGRPFMPYKNTTTGVTSQNPTIKLRNYPHRITLKGKLMKDADPELLKKLVDLLVDDLVKADDSIVSPSEKIELFKQFIHVLDQDKKQQANKLQLSIGDGKINIYIGNKLLALEDKEQAKKDLEEFLKPKTYFTYVKPSGSTYNAFTIDAGVLKIKEEPYNAFISKYLIARIMVDKNTGKGMVNNGHFTFSPINESEIVQEEANKVAEKANEELKKSNYDLDLFDDLERSKLIESRSNKIQEAAADKWIDEAAILKVEVDGRPVLTAIDARNIVNSDSFATFARATMTLYKGGNSTHMYHEAWHAFSQIYLKKDERDKIYKDASKLNVSFTYVKKIPGPGGNTNKTETVKLNTLDFNNKFDRKILEEFIAEEFRVFAMNGGKFKVQNKKANILSEIFRKIWEFLKAIFKGTLPVNVYSNPGSNVFSEMFNALYNAKKPSDLNMYQPSIHNAEFGELNTGAIDVLSELDLDLISRSMDGIISDFTTDLITVKGKTGAAMQIFANPEKVDKVYNVILKKALSDRLKILLAEKASNEAKWNTIEKSYYNNNISILKTAIEQFGDIKEVLNGKATTNSVSAYHYKNSAFAGRIKDALLDPTDKSETEAETIMAQNDKSANSHASEKLATASARYILESLVQQEYNANKTQRINKLNKLGFPQTIEFIPFWNFIMNKAGGEQNIEDLYDKLVSLADKKINPLVEQLLEKLGDPNTVILGDTNKDVIGNKVSADIWIGMVRSMNLTRIDFHNNIFESSFIKASEGDVSFSELLDEKATEKLTVVSGRVSADYFNIRNNIWKNKFNLETGDFIKINPETKQNELDLPNIAKAFLTDPTNSKERVINSDRVVEYRLKPGQDPIAFLNAIGLYMSNDYEVRNNIDSESIDYIANKIGQAYFNQITISDPVKFLNTAINIRVQKLIGDKLESVEGLFRLASLATTVNTLAQVEADNSTEYSSQMKALPDGNKKSINSLNSTTTKAISAINHVKDINELGDSQGKYGIVPQWIYTKNPKVMGSIYKNSLFDGNTKIEGSEIVLVELVGSQHKIKDGVTEGLSHGDMTKSEKFISDLQSMLSTGFIEALRAGEKSTYLGMRPDTIITLPNYKKKSNHLIFDTEHFLLSEYGKSVTGVRIDEHINTVMHKKLEGELRTIQKFNDGITETEARALGLVTDETSPEDITKITKNFYKNNIKGFDNGFKFDWFEEVLESSEYGATLKEDLINLYASQLNTTNNLVDLLTSTNEGKVLKKKIDAQIQTYFKNLAAEFKTQNYDKIFDKDAPIPEFLKNLATQGLTELQKSQLSKESIIEGLMMSFAVNTALHTDEIILMIFGDGFQFNHTKEEALKRVPTYSSPGIVFSTGDLSVAAISKYYPRELEAKLIAEGVINSRTTPREFNKIGNKVIVKEPVIKASRYEEWHDLFKKTLNDRKGYTPEEVDELLYGKGLSYNDEPASGSIMANLAGIQYADGQGYITLDYYRMLKGAENNWTPKQEILYQKEIKGEFISAKDISDAFPVYKLQYAGSLALPGTMYPIQSIDKFSLLPLIPSLIKNSPLETINIQMMNQGADYMLFDSGAKRSYIKSGETNGDNIYEGNGSSGLIPDFKFTLNPFYVDYLKNQTEVNKIFKEQVTLSTQFRKIFDVGLYQEKLPIDYTGTKDQWNELSDSEKKKASKIYENTEAVLHELDRLTTYMRKDLIKEIGWKEKPDGTLDGDLDSMLTYIKKKLADQDYSQHEIDAIESDNGRIDLSTNPIAPRLERFLFAIINNKLVKLKSKGEAFVQASSVFTNPTDAQKGEHSDFGLSDYVADINGLDNTKGTKVKIAITANYENLYQTSYFVKNKEGIYTKSNTNIAVYKPDYTIDEEASFKRLNEMIKVDAWLNSDDNREKIQITGVRIPVQGANSTEFAEIWEFLPASAGPIIIIPPGIVAKSGGDFDVDKLTMYIKHISSQGTLLLDTVDSPDELNARIIELEGRLDVLKASKLNIKNSLEDFRKALTSVLGHINMSPEQVKRFTDKDNKALLKALSNEYSMMYIKRVAPEAHAIYTKKIKSFIVDEYDTVDNAIKQVLSKNGELGSLYRELSDLKDHKRNFIAVIQNSMIGNLIKVLEMPEMAFSLLLPNGTYLAKPFADKLKDTLREVDNSVDFNKSINTGKQLSGRKKGINPGTLRNYNYNLTQQQNNAAGKQVLGPIVLEIPISNQLNKAGALLNSDIVEKITIRKKEQKVSTPITLELRHNFVNTGTAAKEIRRISMSNILDVDKKNQIADVLSQLANGAVDVGKDAWITYLQGNLEAIPKLLFLLEAGVAAEDVFYFVNNPLIRDYVRVKQAASSKMAKVFYGVGHNRTSMINEYLDKTLSRVKTMNPDAAYNMKTLWGKYNLMNTYMSITQVQPFSRDILEKVAQNKGTEEQKMAGLLQYLYVEHLTDYHDKLKQAYDVDNDTTGDNFETQAKLEEIENTKDLLIYDQETLDYFKDKSVISSFFIQDLAVELFGENLFPFRADKNLDKFIRDVQDNWELMSKLKSNTGIAKDLFAPKFKNALTLHILSNALGEFNSKDSLYKGIAITDLLNTKSPITSVAQALDDFKTKKFLSKNKSDESYLSRGLFPISELYLAGYTANDFLKLTLEREYLRKHQVPHTEALEKTVEFKTAKNKLWKQVPDLLKSWTPQQVNNFVYESMLLHRALLNTYNNYEMFVSGEYTVAKKLIDIIKNYPDLNYNYGSLLERFSLDSVSTPDKSNPRRNFKIKAIADITKPEANDYFNKWSELADPNKHKLSGTKPEDFIANKYISDFFAELPVYAFLQSGMDPSQFSMNNILPTDNYQPIMDAAVVKFKEEVLSDPKKTTTVLSKFFTIFLTNNNSKLYELRGRGLDYKRTLYVTEPTELNNITKVTSEEKLDELVVNSNGAATLIKQSSESQNPTIHKTKFISDADLAAFKMYMEKSKSVLPKEFFTSNTRFKLFYNDETGRRDGAPQTSKWLLNAKNLYDLVDKETGEIYLTNVNLETGYQETPVEEVNVEETITETIKPSNPVLLKNEDGLIIAENVIPKAETIKIVEQAKDFIEKTSFKQTGGAVSWGYGMQWMRISAMTPKQREGLVTGKQLNGKDITQAMKSAFIKTGNAVGFPLYGYTNIDQNGEVLPQIPKDIINYLASIGIDVSQYDASYNSVYDKDDSGSLIIHQDNSENNQSPIITISLGRPMKFITYELKDANDFNVADSNNTAFRIAVNAVKGEALKLDLIPASAKDAKGNIKYGHLTPDTLIRYAEQIDKKQGSQLKQLVIDKLKEQFRNAEKTEYDLKNGAVLVFSGNNRNVLHEIVFDEETNKQPMESGFPTLSINKAYKGLGHKDKMVETNDYRVVFTLRKVEGPTLTNVVNEQKLIGTLTQTSTQVQGVEISSNAKGLAAALTNPTELAKSKGNVVQSYPVEFRGKTYKDAEAAYQALKNTATKDEGPNSTYNLMVDIIKAKLQQYPRLVSEITKQGGSNWILASIHQPTKQNSVWETGGKNWFIKALNDAYLSITPTQVQSKSIGVLTEEQIALAKANKIEQNFYDKKPYPKEKDSTGKVTKWDVYKSSNGKSSMQAALDGDRTESTRSVTEIEKLEQLAKSQGITTGITGTIVWMEGQVDNVKGSKNIQGDWFTITSEPYTPNKADFNAYENWEPSVWENRNSEFKIGKSDEWKSIRFERVTLVAPTQVQSTILPTDKIIFGHSTIGKSYLKKAGRTDFITLDDDYKVEIEKFIDKNKGNKTRQEYKGSKPKEYNDFMVALYDKVKKIAEKEGKKLLVSNTHILKTRMADFDKVINVPTEEFERRLKQRDSFKDYDFKDWKSDIDATIAKVSPEKVITTNKYLSDLLPTQVQSTEALPNDKYKYFGSPYDIVRDAEGKGIDVVGYKGKATAKQKLLDAYNTNPNVDPQNGQVFRTTSSTKNEEQTEEKTPHEKKYELFPGVYANEGQRIAIDKITKFLTSDSDEFLLKGRGGTGKTTIIKKALTGLPKRRVIGATVAYEAKEVLQENMPGYKTSTMASLLGLVPDYDAKTGQVFFRERDAEEEEKFRAARKEDPIENKDYIIIDEASMISEFLYNKLLEKKLPNAKIIFMGDNVQIPPINDEGDSKDSPVWDLTDGVNFAEITERMRQGAESPILGITDAYAENVENMQNDLPSVEDPLTNRISDFDGKEGVLFLTSKEELINDFINEIKDSNNTKQAVIITARNAPADKLNDNIREKMFNTNEPYVKGDFIRVNSPYVIDGEVQIPNGFKGKVTAVEEKGYSIPGITLKTYKLTVSYTRIDSDGKAVPASKSFNTINPKEKLKLKAAINQLAVEAKKYPKGSQQARDAWSNFYSLKGSIVDVGYGYAITSHKVQGSTYNSAYVLENDIMSFPGGKEQNNRMMYTAVSRPKKKLVIYNPVQTVPVTKETLETKPIVKPEIETAETKIEKRKRIALRSIQDSIKNFRIDEILAEKGVDIQDIISTLEAAKTDAEITDITVKLVKLLC